MEIGVETAHGKQREGQRPQLSTAWTLTAWCLEQQQSTFTSWVYLLLDEYTCLWCFVHTILRFEDDFSGSGLESLNQWWVFEFEQGDEEIDEREGGYGAHPPLQSSEDQQLHPLDCFHVEDKPFIILLTKVLKSQYSSYSPYSYRSSTVYYSRIGIWNICISTWISETEYSVSFIFNAKQTQEIAVSFTTQGFTCCKHKVHIRYAYLMCSKPFLLIYIYLCIYI